MTEVVASKKVKWKKTGKFIGKHVLLMFAQLVPVAVGVYLGIVASDWNTARKQRAAQKEFLNNLYLEIAANKVKLEKAATYQNSIRVTADSLQHSLSKETLNMRFWAAGGFTILVNWKGVKVPSLENSVYQTGIIGNTLSGLDFKTISIVAQIYNFQEEYKPLSQKLFTDRVINIKNETTLEVLQNFDWLYDLTNSEKELVDQYEMGLKHLKAKADSL